MEKSHGSLVAEVGGKLYYDVVPGTASFFLGYEATWLDGVAVAPSQAINNFNPINSSTTPFINGAVLGAMFRW
ncbi:MAG: hypothetical protein GTO41_03200 [Burkholderiales bacterium]|nr:hypothetical protein [Burkholderiales bacterium]